MLFVAAPLRTRAQCAKRSLKLNSARLQFIPHMLHLGAVQAIARLYHLTSEDIRMDGIFYELCQCNQFASLRWLVRSFNISVQLARASNNFALRGACRMGHLAVAQLLATHFDLTAEDARADDNFALRWSCGKGHLAVAQWLVEHFDLTRTDAQTSDNFALLLTCQNGHLAVAQWLVARFGLTTRRCARREQLRAVLDLQQRTPRSRAVARDPI